MKIKLIFLIFLPLWMNPGFSQKFLSAEELIQHARMEIDSLCSDRFGGRGYIDDGHMIAANYLEKRFREIGLKPILPNASYQQKFPIEINLISEGSLTLNKTRPEPGKDFIVNLYSASGKISGKVVDLGYGLKDPTKSLNGKIALVRAGWPEEIANDAEKKKQYRSRSNIMDRLRAIIPLGPKGVIIVQKKLTAGFVREQFPVPVIEVKADLLPRKVKKAQMEVKAGLERVISQNVMGLIEGKTSPDTAILLTAHYDHLGKLNDAVFAGANDNASGTTMMLSMAEYFAKPENALPYSLLFIGFGGEETGLMGSRYYVERDRVIPLEQTKFILNLDLMGNGDEGIMAVGGRDYPDFFEQLKGLNGDGKFVPKVRSRKNAPNSDHFFFLQNGVPGFFIYTLGGPPHYHDVNDNASTIVLSKYVEVRELLIRFLESVD